MSSWSITITTSGGKTIFSPDPLSPVEISDDVSWANETDSVHQLAVQGVTFTEPIKPFESSTPSYVCNGKKGDSIPYNCVIPGHMESGTIKIGALLLCALLIGFFSPSARAQDATPIDCSPIVGQPLQEVPKIDLRDATTKVVRGTLVTAGANIRLTEIPAGGKRLAGSLLSSNGKPDPAKIQCKQQWSRSYSKDAPRGSQESNAPVINPLPGPTIRAKVGDLVELTFLNLIEPLRFQRADIGRCDQFFTIKNGVKTELYPAGAGDKFPDCFNESIITNVHYHGTHTNPQSSGDNVFLLIKPSPRSMNTARTPAVDANSVSVPFSKFFERCEAELPAPRNVPKLWPKLWRDAPKEFTDWADNTVMTYAPDLYKQNQNAIANGAWPQNYVGAVPYCFPLPEYPSSTWPPAPAASTMSAHTGGAGSAEMDMTQAPTVPLVMGQAPGTQWYHAHKHGSTTINVSNGMTGVFVIEGKYDDEIKAGYNNDIKEQVLVVQQLGGTPKLETGTGPGGGPYFSVNGALQPTIAMQPGEVQWWRIANTSSRSATYFLKPTNGITWKQLAQDGVQFNNTNYTASWNNSAPFVLASGNRADLLVKAPTAAGTYAVLVYNEVDAGDILPSQNPVPLTLLNVVVSGGAKNMPFLTSAPTFPPFLADIAAADVKATRTLVFKTIPVPPGKPSTHTIDGKQFDGEVGAAVVLNQTEEWKIVNETYGKDGLRISHPFHIHINPFQITEIFDPNARLADGSFVYVTSNPGNGQCLIDPANPTTWKPCANVAPPVNIWWDVFPIPSGRQFGTAPNLMNVPGYFKMRSRFVDYAGYYVLHCHILAHEDRGMMTVVYVTPLQPPFSHH